MQPRNSKFLGTPKRSSAAFDSLYRPVMVATYDSSGTPFVKINGTPVQFSGAA